MQAVRTHDYWQTSASEKVTECASGNMHGRKAARPHVYNGVHRQRGGEAPQTAWNSASNLGCNDAVAVICKIERERSDAEATAHIRS